MLRQRHVVRLETRPANIEGKGAVTQRDLVINALRMRPDRIVVGEVRGEEALDMLQAMNTGHDGSLTTIHANSPRDALYRLDTMVAMANLNIPEKAIRQQVASAVNLVVQVIAHVGRHAAGHRHLRDHRHGEATSSPCRTSSCSSAPGSTRTARCTGAFRATGIRPKCARAARQRRASRMPPEMFEHRSDGEVGAGHHDLRRSITFASVAGRHARRLLAARRPPEDVESARDRRRLGKLDAPSATDGRRRPAPRDAAQRDSVRSTRCCSDAGICRPPSQRLIEQSGCRRSPSARSCSLIVAAAALGWPGRLVDADASALLAARSSWRPGAVLPYLVRARASARKRLQKFEEQFPEAIDLIARALRAGHAFTTGLGMVADEMPAPVGTEFRALYDEQNFGMSLPDALRAMARRVPVLDARFFVTAVLTQRESGGNLAECSTTSSSSFASASRSSGRSASCRRTAASAAGSCRCCRRCWPAMLFTAVAEVHARCSGEIRWACSW